MHAQSVPSPTWKLRLWTPTMGIIFIPFFLLNGAQSQSDGERLASCICFSINKMPINAGVKVNWSDCGLLTSQ